MKHIVLLTILFLGFGTCANAQTAKRKGYVAPEDVKKGSFTDPRDGQSYKTLKIGKQEWMAENLRYDVPSIYTTYERIDTIHPEKAYHHYGRFYDWATVMKIRALFNEEEWAESDLNHQGICPDGWHIPNDKEWQELEISLGLSPLEVHREYTRGTIQGNKLKSNTGWFEDKNGVNEYGWNGLPTGNFFKIGFDQIGLFAFYFSSTEHTKLNAFGRYLMVNSGQIGRTGFSKVNGGSCRCVKNKS